MASPRFKEFAMTTSSPAVRSFGGATYFVRASWSTEIRQRHVDSFFLVVNTLQSWSGYQQHLFNFDYVRIEPIVPIASSGFRCAAVDSVGRPNLRVVSPFFVEIEHSPEGIVIGHHSSGVYGYGQTESEALADFSEAVAQLYEELQENRANLGPAAEEVARILESKIRAS